MGICEKIANVGNTLQANLNARGVDCIFGKDSGESTILEMVEMITPNNLKGSADSLISISANKPYLLSGETTDLIVELKNGLGVPLGNKSVTISDGTSSYEGVTNNLGIFTLFNVGISATTTFTATYQSVSATCKVILATKRDYGTQTNHNDIWATNTTSSTIKVTRADTYTEFAELTSTNLANNVSGLSENSIIEFDYYQVDGGNNSFMQIFNSSDSQIYSGGVNIGNFNGTTGNWYHFKISFVNNNVHIENTTTGVSVDRAYTSTPYKFGFWGSNNITAIRFKNFAIY